MQQLNERAAEDAQMHREKGRSPRVGLFLNTAEGTMDGETPRWSDTLALARRAEEAGFDAVWLPDHLLFRFEGEPPLGAWEGWSLLAALAAGTERIHLGPLVTCIGHRNPALLAKMADTVDEISGGRLILGLGAGWHEPEFRAFGSPFDHRVTRFEEALTIITALLRDGRVDFEGTYHRARECELRPRGPRSNGPPIMVGATGERMFRLTARHADIWNGEWWKMGADGRPAAFARLNAACQEIGRDPVSLTRTLFLAVDAPGAPPSGRGWLAPVSGSSEELAVLLRTLAGEGIAEVQVWLAPTSLAGIEAFSHVLELLPGGQ